jgi:hypothetical protein
VDAQIPPQIGRARGEAIDLNREKDKRHGQQSAALVKIENAQRSCPHTSEHRPNQPENFRCHKAAITPTNARHHSNVPAAGLAPDHIDRGPYLSKKGQAPTPAPFKQITH